MHINIQQMHFQNSRWINIDWNIFSLTYVLFDYHDKNFYVLSTILWFSKSKHFSVQKPSIKIKVPFFKKVENIIFLLKLLFALSLFFFSILTNFEEKLWFTIIMYLLACAVCITSLRIWKWISRFQWNLMQTCFTKIKQKRGYVSIHDLLLYHKLQWSMQQILRLVFSNIWNTVL